MSNSDITLYPTKDKHSILVDARRFPIICPDCSIILPNLYQHKSSRYGYVGAEMCNCGKQIHINDNDHEFVTHIILSTKSNKIEIDFQPFFHFTNNSINILKRKYKYDILKNHPEKWVSLDDVLIEIEVINDIKIEPIKSGIPLPMSIKKWFGLMTITEVKKPSVIKN